MHRFEFILPAPTQSCNSPVWYDEYPSSLKVVATSPPGSWPLSGRIPNGKRTKSANATMSPLWRAWWSSRPPMPSRTAWTARQKRNNNCLKKQLSDFHDWIHAMSNSFQKTTLNNETKNETHIKYWYVKQGENSSLSQRKWNAKRLIHSFFHAVILRPALPRVNRAKTACKITHWPWCPKQKMWLFYCEGLFHKF